MKEVLQKKTLFVVIPLLIALLSVFVLSGPASSPDLHGSTLAALEEKQTTVLELSAASAAASAAITCRVPGKISADHHRNGDLFLPDPRVLPAVCAVCPL